VGIVDQPWSVEVGGEVEGLVLLINPGVCNPTPGFEFGFGIVDQPRSFKANSGVLRWVGKLWVWDC